MFVSKFRKKFYLFFRDENGKRIKVTTGCTSKSSAISFLQSFNKDEYKKKLRSRTVSFSVFYDEYFSYASGVLTPKTVRTYQCAFREAIRIMGDVPIHSITLKHAEQFVSIKKNETSEWSARKYLICLASAFQKACDWKLIKENPFRHVKKPKLPETLPLYLNPKEFQTLFSVISDAEFREFCLVAILTGMRLGELLHLSWTNINFEEKCITVQSHGEFFTKNKRARKIPVNNELLFLLLNRKSNLRSECDWVFHDSKGKPYKENLISKKFKFYVKLSGINPKIHFHSLRHSYASALVKEGISLYAVQKLLGHRSIKTTEIYCHLSPDQLHREVETGLRSFTFNKY